MRKMPRWNLRQIKNNLYIPANDLIVLITAKKDTNDGCQRTRSLIDFFPFSISLTCRTISIENRVYRLYDRIIVGYINEKKKCRTSISVMSFQYKNRVRIYTGVESNCWTYFWFLQ